MDQTQDLLAKDFYRYTRLWDAPDFVKSASQEDLCGTTELPAHLYGDPAKRLYPCHTPAATWTSLAYLIDKQAEVRPAQVKPVVKRIFQCGQVHGIADDLHRLYEKAAADRPSPEDALPDDCFALLYDGPHGRERHYPLRNGPEVQKAASYLLQYRERFPFELRQLFADRVLCKQAELGVRLPEDTQEELEKQAGRGAGTAKDAADMILGRVLASRRGLQGPDNALQQEMRKLAETIRRHPSQLRAPGARCKVAAVVDTFDRQHGLARADNGLPRVEDVLFGLTREKMAACAREHVGLLTGSIYKMADLECVPLREVRDLFGDAFGEQLTSDGLRLDSEKAASVLPRLPTADAHLFDRLLYQLGVQPVYKEAGGQSVGVSNDYLQQILAGQVG